MNNIYNVSEKLFQLNDFSKKTRQEICTKFLSYQVKNIKHQSIAVN